MMLLCLSTVDCHNPLVAVLLLTMGVSVVGCVYSGFSFNALDLSPVHGLMEAQSWPWVVPWWRHQMETFSALLAFCARNSPVTGEFPVQGQWRGALVFSLICAWINGWVNNREAGDLRRHRAHYNVIVMTFPRPQDSCLQFHQPWLVIRTFHRQGRCSRGGHICNEHSEEKYSCSYK